MANVERLAEAGLTAGQAEEIRACQQAAFPWTPEFAGQRWWHTPSADDDLWFLLRRQDRLIGSVRLVHRTILAGEAELTVGGVANVCSHPEFRGTGAARACMVAAQEYMTGAGRTDFGMLFCGPPVHAFYARLGWQDVHNALVYEDLQGRRVPASAKGDSVPMIYPGSRPVTAWPEGPIDLNGPDW